MMRMFSFIALFGLFSTATFALDVPVPLNATKTIEWKLPAGATCQNGQPLTECPVTGWELQTSPAEHEPFTVVRGWGSATTSFTFTVTKPVCYRIRANSTVAGGFSPPSNHICFIPTKPTTGYVPPAPVVTQK